jgi:hypothetical protein
VSPGGLSTAFLSSYEVGAGAARKPPRKPPRLKSDGRAAGVKRAGNRVFRILMAFTAYGHGWFRTSDLSRVKRALSH